MADDVSDAAVAASRQPGFAPMDGRPEALELRALRPVLHAAVVPFVTEPEPSVRRPSPRRLAFWMTMTGRAAAEAGG